MTAIQHLTQTVLMGLTFAMALIGMELCNQVTLVGSAWF
jgi:hypothetical protein